MSDYHFGVGITRSQMVDALAENPEHFLYVLASILGSWGTEELQEAMDAGSWDIPSESREEVVKSLRNLATLVEEMEN